MDNFVYKNLSINKVIHNLDKKLVEKESYSQVDKKIKEQYNVLHKKGVFEMAISLRLSEADSMLFKKFAEMNGITVSELIRSSVMERIEDEYDLKVYKKAMQEFKKNPVTYSLEEVEKELNLK